METPTTLAQLHQKWMIDALQDDHRINYAKRIITVEMMARQFGWDHECNEENIAIRIHDIFNT